jgi:hypothetical protein
MFMIKYCYVFRIFRIFPYISKLFRIAMYVPNVSVVFRIFSVLRICSVVVCIFSADLSVDVVYLCASVVFTDICLHVFPYFKTHSCV